MAQNKKALTALNRGGFADTRPVPVATAPEKGQGSQTATKYPESGGGQLRGAPVIRANMVSFGISQNGRTHVTFFDCG
jgi:hypothetical protein